MLWSRDEVNILFFLLLLSFANASSGHHTLSGKVSYLILQVHCLLGLESKEIFSTSDRGRILPTHSGKSGCSPWPKNICFLLFLLCSELPMSAKVLQCLWPLLFSSCDTTWLFVHLIAQNFVVMCWGIFCCWYTEQIFGEFLGPSILHFLMKKGWESWDYLAWRRPKGDFMNLLISKE